MPLDQEPFDYDVFISHASEDKDEIARPLAEALQAQGLRVWFDEWSLVMGDRLRRKIDEGLKRSRFGVVVLSKNFFSKNWPQQELDGLSALEADGSNRILPIWHGVSQAEVGEFSPTLADRLAAESSRGLEVLVAEIQKAIFRIPKTSPVPAPVRRARRQAVVNDHLRPRNLLGDEAANFGMNDDSKALGLRDQDCRAECAAFVTLSLVPAGREEELDSAELVRWAAGRLWPAQHPLAGDDIRPRTDGVIVRVAGRDDGKLSRYTHISGDGYVEWGRALGGCYEDVCIVRLGPLLWAVSHLYDFLGELRAKFDLRSEYELVVSIPHAKGTCLTHLGERWLEPWERGYWPYRPACLDEFVQYRTSLPFSTGEEDRKRLLLDLDLYLNQVWGDGNPRGHDHIEATKTRSPVLSDNYRARDPWE